MGSERHQHPAPLVSERIGMEPPRCRHDRVTDWMAEGGVDALVAARADLVTWLAGYSRYYGGLSAVIIGRDGERVLVVPRDEVAVAEQWSDADRVTGYGERGFGLELNPAPLLLGEVRGLGVVSSARRIATAGEPAADFAPPAGVDKVSADAALHQLSLVKDADELARIYHSYELCWVAQAAVADGAAAGATEIEIMTAAQSAAQVAHGSPIEFAADLRSGATGAQVFGAMRDRILAIRPDGEFPHHGGHGVGLSVFDDPHVIPSDEQRLENWMVLALEPGIYLPGQFGVRRENLFLVTPDGGVELTQAVSRPLSARAHAGWTA